MKKFSDEEVSRILSLTASQALKDAEPVEREKILCVNLSFLPGIGFETPTFVGLGCCVESMWAPFDAVLNLAKAGKEKAQLQALWERREPNDVIVCVNAPDIAGYTEFFRIGVNAK